jgi:gamma-glutamyltranspeptidase/glutathione hydrolase
MKWADLFAPATFYAENGFPVTDLIAEQWSAPEALALLKRNPNAAATYLPDGRAPKAGGLFRNPNLATSLRQIAASGRNAFYSGEIAARILEISKELGGTLSAADLSQFEAEWVTPISTEYRGWTVSEIPPNGQGIAALMMLNIMERYPLQDFGPNSVRALHVMVEAKKLAYADMLRQVGDPRFSDIPVKRLLSKEFAAERASLLDMQNAACSALPAQLASIGALPGADTIYMTVVDRDGNMVSLIQSNYLGFGSGVVPRGTGFMLQNRGSLFTLERKHPNSLAPRKRPLHTIIPGFMANGDVRIAFGIMGGWNQAQAHAQFVSNVVDHGMDMQQALEMPRFTKQTFDGCAVSMESRIPESVRGELTKLGHDIKLVGPYSQRVGGGQAILRTADGIQVGGSDPRKDGAALPESPGFSAMR